MQVKIFCDAFKESGLGHLRRCEKLLMYLKNLGVKSSIHTYKQQKGCLSFLNDIGSTDFIIIDSYQLLSKDFYAFKKKAKALMVIEDSEHKKGFYPKHTSIINGTLGAKNYYKHLSQDCFYYLGAEFLPISFDFCYKRSIVSQVEHVLITLGGSKQDKLKDIVKILENKNVVLHVISQNIIKEVKNIHYYNHLSLLEFSHLMKSCDVAISAGGMTLYELVLSQTPSLILPIATNQLAQSLEFEKLGVFKITSLETLERDFENLITLKERKKQVDIFKTLNFGEYLERALKEFLGR
ncbi:CMP-N-acetylneuraminic acid synthetase [Helicobacter cetorum]|uniref:CMP-N-acetylneuraminic acid synthetase n=1 Tax=Helicobacter cetorum TaxID=138563 RepID=UPI000CF19FA4|nr:CMP-N-acetylneuraminic acid synthetase [Helicobacter cetorum]